MKSPLLFQNQPAIELSDAENRLVISPAHGARILRWERRGREIIRWPEDADWSQVLKVRGGNPILFPFIARHFVDGKQDLWRDALGVVRPMPQHGFARDAVFSVVDDAGTSDGPDAVRFRLTDSESTRACYPFAFIFDVVIALRPDSRVEIRFETTNRGESPLPYYAGHHFYLAIPHGERAEWTLDLPCAAWGRQDPATGSILRSEPQSGLLRLDDRSLNDRFQIAPSRSTVTLANSTQGKTLSFDLAPPGSIPWYAVTTWTANATADFYCVEPWLGLPNAIHHGEGLRWLEPGKSETAACIINGASW